MNVAKKKFEAKKNPTLYNRFNKLKVIIMLIRLNIKESLIFEYIVYLIKKYKYKNDIAIIIIFLYISLLNIKYFLVLDEFQF